MLDFAPVDRRPINGWFSVSVWAFLTLAALVSSSNATAAASGTSGAMVRFGVFENAVLPLAEFRDGRPVRGIVVDMSHALAKEAGATGVIVPLPRLRLEPALQRGDVDAICFLTPGWVRNDPDSFGWTPALFTIKTLLVSRLDAPTVNVLSDIPKGETLGTVRGYLYPSLEATFSSGRLRRDDAPNSERNFQKLKRGRFRHMLVGDLHLDYFQHLEAAPMPLQAPLNIDETPIQCAFSPGQRENWPTWRAAANRLLKRGEPQRWLESFR